MRADTSLQSRVERKRKVRFRRSRPRVSSLAYAGACGLVLKRSAPASRLRRCVAVGALGVRHNRVWRVWQACARRVSVHWIGL